MNNQLPTAATKGQSYHLWLEEAVAELLELLKKNLLRGPQQERMWNRSPSARSSQTTAEGSQAPLAPHLNLEEMVGHLEAILPASSSI